MTPHGVAWLIAAGAVLGGLLALWGLTRRWRWPRTKVVAAVLLTVWLLVPAPVPGYPDHYAPAFLVFLFEWLLQQSGQPRIAGVILLAGTVLTVALLLLVRLLLRRRHPDR